MEYFSVLNKKREKLNYRKARGDNLLDFEYNEGVELWLFNDKKLLITKRSAKKSHPFKWEVPGGCAMENETSFQTLKRELAEELSLNLSEQDVKFLTTKLYKKQFIDLYISTKKIALEKLSLEADEVIDAKFVTKEEFKKMAQKNEVVESCYQRFLEIEKELKDF